MIKFTARSRDGEKRLIGIGLTEENIQRLTTGQPAVARGSDLGIDSDIVVFYGKTIQDLYFQCEPFIGKNTRFNNDTTTNQEQEKEPEGG